MLAKIGKNRETTHFHPMRTNRSEISFEHESHGWSDFLNTNRTNGADGAKGGSKIRATLHEKRKTAEKYKKEPRARRAYSPFIPIRFSRVHTFPPNPTQLGFKV